MHATPWCVVPPKKMGCYLLLKNKSIKMLCLMPTNLGSGAFRLLHQPLVGQPIKPLFFLQMPGIVVVFLFSYSGKLFLVSVVLGYHPDTVTEPYLQWNCIVRVVSITVYIGLIQLIILIINSGITNDGFFGCLFVRSVNSFSLPYIGTAPACIQRELCT